MEKLLNRIVIPSQVFTSSLLKSGGHSQPFVWASWNKHSENHLLFNDEWKIVKTKQEYNNINHHLEKKDRVHKVPFYASRVGPPILGSFPAASIIYFTCKYKLQPCIIH